MYGALPRKFEEGSGTASGVSRMRSWLVSEPGARCCGRLQARVARWARWPWRPCLPSSQTVAWSTCAGKERALVHWRHVCERIGPRTRTAAGCAPLERTFIEIERCGGASSPAATRGSPGAREENSRPYGALRALGRRDGTHVRCRGRHRNAHLARPGSTTRSEASAGRVERTPRARALLGAQLYHQGVL